MRETNYDQLSDEQKELLNAAEAVMKNSYNPYSHFAVGAALLTPDGTIISGTNFENAAYGSSICAERAAILRANAMGYRNFKAIAVIAKGEQPVETIVSPCGACRQVIYEVSDLSDQTIEVIMSNTRKDHITIANINQLLPLGFGPKSLGMN
jgi:cytidine deaminase